MSILATQGFQGTLIKLNAKGGEVPVMTLAIKHTEEGEFQSFLETLEKAFGLKNICTLFETPVQFDSMVISSPLNKEVTVEFDEVEFDGYLRSIKIARKDKSGTEVFTYTLSFDKDVSSTSIDKTLALEYLNRKEEVDGKKVLQTYQVKIKPKAESNIDILD